MILYLRHGRDTMPEKLGEWGYDGPDIECIGIHQTYANAIRVHFKSEYAANEAQLQTGWKKFGDNALTMRKAGDLVEVSGKFYGAWGLR